MRTTDHTERPENSCTAAGRVVPVVLTGLMAGALAFGVAAPAHAAGDSPAPPSGSIASAATRESTPVATGRPTSSSTSRPVAEPISRDKVIVRDDAPAAVATIEPGAEEAPSEQGDSGTSDAPAASATDEADGRDEASQADEQATTAPAAPTPQTSAPTESPTATATLTAVPTVAPLGIAVPKLERPTRVPEAPLTPRPWKAYPVPADPSPAKPSPKSTSTVPVLARGMSMSAMAAQRGVKVAAAPAEEESAISSTVLGLFGLSLLAAGATLLVAVRARAKR